jgi:Glucodextranase, domain B
LRLARTKRSWMLAPLALAILAFAPAVASATVTTSQVTSPGDPYYGMYDGDLPSSDPANQVTISGTTDGTTGDQVDVYCFHGTYWGGTSSNNVASNVSVDADGSFSVSVRSDNISWEAQTCRLRAVPTSGWNNSDLPHFAGPRVNIAYKSTNKVPVQGAATDQTYDYYVGAGGLKGFFETESLSSCGPYNMGAYLNPGSFAMTSQGDNWDCVAALYNQNLSNDASQLRIDGLNAYTTYGLPTYDWDGPGPGVASKPAGSPALDVSVTRDASNGNMTITEVQQIVACPTNAFPADGSNCDTVHPTGVRLTRVIKMDHDGLVVTITDTWSSVDGNQHTFNADYDNYVQSYEYATFKFPGDDQFTTYAQGDVAPLGSSAPGTIYTRDSDYPDSIYQGVGGLTYATQPNEARFNWSNQEFQLNYPRTIPAGGSLTMTHVAFSARNTDQAKALGAEVEDRLAGPSVSITAPANGSTTDVPQTTVTGKATDNGGIASLTVNGVSTPVAADGTFSAPVGLNVGENVVTAVAADKAGNTTQAQTTVNYVPKAVPATPTTPAKPAPTCKVPKISRGSTLKTTEKKIRAAGCKVGKIKRARSTTKLGRVIAISPKGGAVKPLLTKVNVTLSAGKKVVKHGGRSAAKH